MPDVQEVFRQATRTVRPYPGALERQHRRQRRAGRNRRLGAFAAVAAVAVVAFVGVAVLEGRDEGKPGPSVATQPGGLDPGLYLVDVATGEISAFNDPGPGSYDFEFSPDGSALLMVIRDEELDRDQVWLADSDGTNLRQITHDEYGAREPTWFPDGNRIAFIAFNRNNDRQIFVLDLTTGERTQLSHEPSLSGRTFTPSVTPDGRSVLYSTSRTSDAVPGIPPPPTGLLRAVDVETGEVRTLFRNPSGYALGPVAAPDGTIAFIHKSGPNGDQGSEPWILPPDGDAQPLDVPEIAALADFPRWSPDGSLLAYSGGSADGSGWNVWVYDPTSGESTLVAPGWVESWDGDGRLLIGV